MERRCRDTQTIDNIITLRFVEARSLSAKANANVWLVPAMRTMLAPGCTSGPFNTHLRSFSMLYRLTRSGYVIVFATSNGTPTWSMAQIGAR